MPEPKIRVWLTRQADNDDNESSAIFGLPALAYDVQILHINATVGDYLQALEDFQAQTLADCKGCDGCCHERAPLTIADWQLSTTEAIEATEKTAPDPTPAELAGWLRNWAELHFFGQAIDLRLPRTAAGACQFLDQQNKCCTKHRQRSFTCRTHCCLPKTERAEALRSVLINAGEDELVRRLLQIPAELRPWAERLSACRIEDYPPNAFSALPAAEWRRAELRGLLAAEPELWRQLLAD